MGFSCPHCSQGIEGAVSQETLTGRLKAKDDEIGALKAGLSTAQTKASSFDAVVAERDQLRTDFAALQEAGSRKDAFSAQGLKPELLDSFAVLYKSAQAGAEEAKSFADWLADDAKSHPLLSPHFTTVDTPPATSEPATTTAPPQTTAPRIDASAEPPPPPQGKLTRQQVSEHLASLPLDQRKAWIEENRAKYVGG